MHKHRHAIQLLVAVCALATIGTNCFAAEAAAQATPSASEAAARRAQRGLATVRTADPTTMAARRAAASAARTCSDEPDKCQPAKQ